MKNKKSTLMGLVAGLAVASVGTAGSLYATPVTQPQSVVAATLADTVPVKDTTRPKQDPTPKTLPTTPDTAKPQRPRHQSLTRPRQSVIRHPSR